MANKAFTDRVKRFFWPPSIRNYLILMNLILLCLLLPAISVVFLNEEARFRDAQLDSTIVQMRGSLESRSASLALSMSLSATQAIAGYDYTSLNILLQQVTDNDPELLYALVMDGNRLVISHSSAAMIGSRLDGELDFQIADLFRNVFPVKMPPDYQRRADVRFFEHQINAGDDIIPVMEVVVPVFSGNSLWGVLRCGFSLQGLEERITGTERDWLERMEHFKKYLVTMTAVFFTIGVLVAAVFTRPFVRAVQMLSSGVKRIATGDLDYEIRQQGLVCTEFLDLSQSFNHMTEQLKVSYQKLDEYSKSLEQKVLERTRKLQEAQDAMIKQAHEAGMAEMAVGVLHNIGNAITPAKVSASLLLKRLYESPFREHLEEPLQKIKALVSADATLPAAEKERFSQILKLLPETLRSDYDSIISEIKRIMMKHEHIESIIRLQMHYAQLVGDYEDIDVNRIVDDALSILDDTLVKRAVKVRINKSEVPLVKFEKTKLIQIIVNLLKNAYEAMEQTPVGERILTISTELDHGPPASVVITIKDSGIGFSAEQREQLFTFGYSTKQKGSGFGLHSCANYLIANKGSISAQSGGIGKGAQFVVRLAV